MISAASSSGLGRHPCLVAALCVCALGSAVFAQQPAEPAPKDTNTSLVSSYRSEARQAASNDPEKALALLIKARNLDPNNPDVQYDFAMIALRMSLYSDAAQAFQSTLNVLRDDPNALYGLGRAQIGLTKYQDARDTFEHYLKLKPDDASGHYALGLALAALQLSPEARKQFETSIQQQSVQTESYFQLGLLDLDDKQLAKAAGNFQRVLDRDPYHAGALTGMGRVDFENKEYSKAAELFRQAIATNPTLRQAHYYLGLTYARMGQKDESAKELQIASQLEHDEAEKQRLGLKIIDPEQQ